MTLDDSTSRDSAVDTRVDPCRQELLLLLSGKTNCAWRQEFLEQLIRLLRLSFQMDR